MIHDETKSDKRTDDDWTVLMNVYSYNLKFSRQISSSDFYLVLFHYKQNQKVEHFQPFLMHIWTFTIQVTKGLRNHS